MIDRIVFVSDRTATALRPAERKKVWAKNPARKGWRCPGCDKPVAMRELGGLEMGSAAPDGGRWWVKGTCPHCLARIQFTKHGARVLARDVPTREVTTTIRERRP